MPMLHVGRVAGCAVIMLLSAVSCGSSRDSTGDLERMCRGPLDALPPSVGTECLAAGYYRKLAARRRAFAPDTVPAPEERLPGERRRNGRQLVLAQTSANPGIVTITDHPKAGTVVLEAAFSSEQLTIRPGTCVRPGLGRACHLSYSGEASFTFDRLARSTFAVEASGPEGRVKACAQHLGREALLTDTKPGNLVGKARLIGRALVFRSRSLS